MNATNFHLDSENENGLDELSGLKLPKASQLAVLVRFNLIPGMRSESECRKLLAGKIIDWPLQRVSCR